MREFRHCLSFSVVLLSMLAAGGRDALGARKPVTIRRSGNTVSAVIKPDNLNGGTSTNSSSRAYVREIGYSKDAAGHVIARALGGRGGKNSGNIFPQNPKSNNSSYKRWEKKIIAGLRSGDYTQVAIKVTFRFRDKTKPKRPTDLRYAIEITKKNGSRSSRILYFLNPPPR